MRPYLDSLARFELWLVWIRHIIQCDAIKLTLIDVGYSVILTTLRCTDWRLQVVLEAIGRVTAIAKINDSRVGITGMECHTLGLGSMLSTRNCFLMHYLFLVIFTIFGFSSLLFSS